MDVRGVFFLIRYTIDDPGLKMVMGDECPVSQAVSLLSLGCREVESRCLSPVL